MGRIGKSIGHVIGIRRHHTLNHSQMVMVCQERCTTFSNCGVVRYRSLIAQEAETRRRFYVWGRKAVNRARTLPDSDGYE